ncbi:MAG: multiheme c-type cytochrome [Gammaproteobacteria bacterium]
MQKQASSRAASPTPVGPRRARALRYRPAMGPHLRKLWFLILGAFAVLTVNSAYLGGITLLEWLSSTSYQDYFYQLMFLLHLLVGLLVIGPIIVFAVLHLRSAWPRPNRRAVQVGLGLFAVVLVLLLSGVLLTRFEFFEVNEPSVRRMAYWLHVGSPLLVLWLFLLHRLVGPPIQWQHSAHWLSFALGIAGALFLGYTFSPRAPQPIGPESGADYFFPSLARTATGNFIPANTLMMDAYCRQCHEDSYRRWTHSAHRFASFNNPAYRFSVRETRQVALKRDGTTQASRFCAGCHDPVPFFSGAFDSPEFDDVLDATASAGITCSVCHGITAINSPRGNADYTIAEPIHYPFAYSDHAALQWINRQLIKAKPEFHKATFLKPLHQQPEFCGTCHKVHLPVALNHYKWLRGQDHYGSYLLSGVSGHSVQSFYYPPEAVSNCTRCHMPLTAARDDFGAQYLDDSGVRKVHDHLFPGANTALPHLLGMPYEVQNAHRTLLQDALRLDLFAVRRGGTIDGPLLGPLRPRMPALEPGQRYLLETVVRTLKPGHHFTQGTADSNEVWLEVSVSSGGAIIAQSGTQGPDGTVDPWSYFANAYLLDRHGNRIDRRNPQDIYVPLYDHQIPPGAADVAHYRLAIPDSITEPVTVEVKLQYRKFDTAYMKHFQGARFVRNDLPITTIAVDRVTFPVSFDARLAGGPHLEPPAAAWERWNDYGIGLLRKGGQGELRQAEQAFGRVEQLGRGEGALNLARVYLKEGRLAEAAAALQRATAQEPAASPWSLAWFTGLVNKQYGQLDQAIHNFRQLAATNFPEARRRSFDFSKDHRLLNELGQTLFERAKRERRPEQRAARRALLEEARQWFTKALTIDPESAVAHHNLALIHDQLGNPRAAGAHRRQHLQYKADDNAGDHAIAIHRRRHRAADHAAEAVVIYDLKPVDAIHLTAGPTRRLGPARETVRGATEKP